jgi:hypothetical protein
MAEAAPRVCLDKTTAALKEVVFLGLMSMLQLYTKSCGAFVKYRHLTVQCSRTSRFFVRVQLAQQELQSWMTMR